MGWRIRLLVLTFIGISRADDIQCDASQHLVAVCRHPCPPERTCQNKDGPIPPCVPPMGPCKPQCVCSDGYAKNQYGGYCVTYAQCAQCGKNEYFACDGAYSEDCSGSCYCTTGFKRDYNNTCVSTYTPPTGNPSPPPTVVVLPSPPVVVQPSPPYAPTTEAPPSSEIECDESQHLVAQCRDPCPPERTCQNKDGPEPPCVPPTGPCKVQCVCTDGYAKNQYGGYCVTYKQCDKCPGNNQYFACDGPYSQNCTGSCHCTDGYARVNGTCVSTTPPPVGTHPSPPPPPNTPPPGGPEPVTASPPDSELSCDNTTKHEIPGCVRGCPPERTCQNRNWPPLPCAPLDIPCTPKCICDDGYARNKPDDGVCITFEQCDLCSGDDQYFQCDGEYKEDCNGHCYCFPGYVRDKDGKCVYDDLASTPTSPRPTTETPPAPELSCDVTRHERPACTFGCPPERSCQNRHRPLPACSPPAPWLKCTKRCICENGYVRNGPNGACVTEEECDKCPSENEYFQCDGENSNDCTGHCYCYSGYVRDMYGKCVYVDPASPPGTLTPPVTSTETPKPQDLCSDDNEYFEYDGEYEEDCDGQCYCFPDYMRDKDDKCVYVDPTSPGPSTETPPGTELQCDPANHEVAYCVYPCPPERTCQTLHDPEPPCTPSNPHVCKPTCVCQNGYARNRINGTCVTTEQCDQCPGVSQYFACDGPYSENCKGSCHCATGYQRDCNSTCVSILPTPPPQIYYPPSTPSTSHGYPVACSTS